MKQEIFGNISEREKDIKSMAATINRLKAALNKILEIAGDN
jgi:regulator of replication initiation timing